MILQQFLGQLEKNQLLSLKLIVMAVIIFEVIVIMDAALLVTERVKKAGNNRQRATSTVSDHQQAPEYQSYVGLAEQEVIDRLLDQNLYDWRIRPFGFNFSQSNGGPVHVIINIYLRTISKVDDVNMEYSAHFTFREQWCDQRLIFFSNTLKYIHLTPEQKIWMPDTFFQNEKDGRSHDIDKPNILLRIQNATGCILYSVRLTLIFSCPMNLENYPLDSQYCYIDLASYAYTTADIEYRWKEDNPIQIKAGLRSSLPSFSLSKVAVDTCSSKTNTGDYSCLRLALILKREFSYYLLQLYIPSFMLVMVSWVSFWLDKDSVPARVTLGVTTLLTMSTQASGINAKLPPVSYTKAIDVWIGVCLAFIFGALLEFALVNYAARQDMLDDIQRRRCVERGEYAPPIERNQVVDSTNASTMAPFSWPAAYPRLEETVSSTHRHHRHRSRSAGENKYVAFRQCRRAFFTRLLKLKNRERSKRIDVVSRIIFPLTFAGFNVIYWTNYLIPYLKVITNDDYST